MTDTVMTTATEPDGAPRLANIDILRGIAILGILFMNINAMGGALLMGWFDLWRYGHSGADEVAFFLRNTLADGTARCMLEMLFGVGMVILTDRASQALPGAVGGGRGRRVLHWLFGDWTVLRSYYWRNIVLFAFGLVHIFILLWPGDILHTYGVAALIAFLFRRLAAKWLLGLGLVLALFQLGGGTTDYVTVSRERATVAAIAAKQATGRAVTKDEAAALKKAQDRTAKRETLDAKMIAQISAEDAARAAATGTFMTWAKAQWDVFMLAEGKGLEMLWIWEAAATMLIGAALFKWGVIQGARSARFYAILVVVCYSFGLSSRAVVALNEIADYTGPSVTWGLGELARLATTLGHIGVVNLLLRTGFGAKLLKPFDAAGRTALTIYICQSIICLWILYPPFALGLYGQQGWAAWMAVALAVNAALLLVANWYVAQFRIAPVEWAWRSIIAGKLLPIRKAAGSLAGAGVPAAA